MKNIYKISFILLTAIFCFFTATAALAQLVGGVNLQTNSATNISNHQATLNGYIGVPYLNSFSNVWFQWGTDSGYNNRTGTQQLVSGSYFSQTITGLFANTTYHFRTVATGDYGTIYGPDVIFYTSGSGYYGNYGNGILTVSKKVINLTSGNLNWATSISAKPSDVLSFAITLQANSQDIHNIIIRDVLPSDLIYRENLMVNTATNYGGDITSGINIGTVYAGQTVVVSYEAQVAPDVNFSFGTTPINNNVIITSNESGTQTATASVVVNKSLVYGASTASDVSTGLTNNFFTDSFFLPLLIIIFCLWLYFSGEIYVFADKLKTTFKR